MSSKQFVLSFILLFVAVKAKDCDCGKLCSEHKGYKKLDDGQEKCFFIAENNAISYEFVQIQNQQEEQFIVDKLLKGITSKTNLSINHNPNYRMKIFNQTCIHALCTHTIYQTKCECKLNIFEKTYQKLKFFYNDYNDIFWVIISLVLGCIFFAVLKCIICQRCQK